MAKKLTKRGAGAASNGVGYRRPPPSGQIQKGEVRNPHGRNGKPKPAADAFEQAASQPVVITIGGKKVKKTTEEAVYLRLLSNAAQGEPRAMNLVSKERLARLGKGPKALTAAELAAEAEEAEHKEELGSGPIKGIPTTTWI